jgi:protein-tyrosine-phosphatase
MKIRKTIVPLICVLLATPARSRVFVHWTQPAVPPAKTLGVSEFVVSWDAGAASLVKTARKQGYRVYAEVALQQASAAAEDGAKNRLAGIILNVRQPEQGQVDEVLRKLRSDYPKLTFLVLNADGKQPDMRGGLVIKRGDILEVSSPTAQPWIDTNLALIRLERASRPAQVPLYSFQWDLSDPLQQQQGPTADDYSLAVAEAGAFHADLLLNLHENLQEALAQNRADAWTSWNLVKRYLEFYSDTAKPRLETAANVGVVIDNYDASYEAINLMARHNIPFRVLRSADLKAHNLASFDLVVVFSAPDRPASETIADFAARGGIAVLVDLHGSYPWQSAPPTRINEHSVSYAVGKGRVTEFSEPVTDPETFAQDIRRLMGKKMLISLWNALTTVAVPYRFPGAGATIVELVNYAGEPLRVQVQVKGSFNSIRYETPEHRCCQSLTPVQHDGLTEFVVPSLRIAGRVHLAAN